MAARNASAIVDRMDGNFVMVEASVEPTMLRNFTDFASFELSKADTAQFVRTACVGLSLGFIFAKMHDSNKQNGKVWNRLFTSIWLSLISLGAYCQVVVVEVDDVVARIRVSLSQEEWEQIVVEQDCLVVDRQLDHAWLGIEWLDERWDWHPCTATDLEVIQGRSKRCTAKSLMVQEAMSRSYLVGQIPVLRWSELRGWEKCLDVEWVVGESPVPAERKVRVWPDQSVLTEGTWWTFSTTEEGVHCLDYDDLQAAGLNPAQLDPSALRLFGHGGKALPMSNDADRHLDVPQVQIVQRGLSDGSLDPGDGICWYAPDLNRWNWDETNGWTHSVQPWADTAKWFLRLDAPDDMSLRLVELGEPYDGVVVEQRNDHIHRGVIDKSLHNLIKSGRNWFGDRLTSLGSTNYAWNVSVPGALIGELATVKFAAAMRTSGSGSPSTLTYSFGEESVQLSDVVLSSLSYDYAKYREGEITAPLTSNGVQVLTTLNPGTSESDAWLDYLSYEVPQAIQFNGGQALFNGLPISDGGAQYNLSGSLAPNEIWNVTDEGNIEQVPTEVVDGNQSWATSAEGVERFCAFRWSSVMHPVNLKASENSNVHGLGEVDEVIVTIPSMKPAADSLASLHALLGKRVAVVMQQDVFDAFSSGMSDPTAIKMLMMMLRDRAQQSGTTMPKYLLLFGDATYENRNLQGNGQHIVGHYSGESLSTTNSYISDDYFTLTAEGQGESPSDKLQFGVGRIPASNLEDAWAFVDKFRTYTGLGDSESDVASCLDPNGGSVYGPWRNRILFVSDDQDGNFDDGHKYMANSDKYSGMIRDEHPSYDILKIYPDAYEQTNTPGGERYEGATAEIARRVEEGALIVNYTGHGGERGWAHERILNLQTIEGWRNLTKLPVFMTATCELFRYDDPDVYSAGEAILFNPEGGGMGLLTTTRTVFTGGNAQINESFYETAMDREDPNRCIGDIYADTKNNDLVTSDINSRNFALMGDPGMRLSYPRERVFVTEVPDTLRSLELVTIRGYVGLANGDTLQDFQGVVVPTVFDKQAEITTLNNDNNSAGPYTYEVFQNVLHRGLASVSNGLFQFTFIVPKDIDYEFGTGRLSLYAVDGMVDANGFSESFVIGGNSSEVLNDDEGPKVELYMNDTLFEAGDVVHEDPWLYARIFDASGINTSGNGIGHDLKAVLDNEASQPFVLNQYFVSDLDTYQSGTVRFPFQGLEDGRHELSLKVWDVANNSATANTEFIVASSLEVALMNVLAFPNPAVDHVTFRTTTNQACRPATVDLQVFDMSGTMVHNARFTGEALGFVDDGLTWDLKPSEGGSVLPGVYVFRVIWENEFGQSAQYLSLIHI